MQILFVPRLNDYQSGCWFSKVLIDNTIGRNKKNWLGNFKELGRVGNFQSFNNQNAITQYMGS
jgi:hypothetical protein